MVPSGDKKKAVVLLSGGLDSTTSLYVALKEGFKPYPLTIHYGQRHAKELECARWIAQHLGLAMSEIAIRLPWQGSALLDPGISLPKGRSWEEMSREIPATYVPARNTIFLSFALSWAEVLGASAIYIGANALDYSGYPDCRPEYFRQMEAVFKKATKWGVEGGEIHIVAPLLQKSKAEIVQWASELGVPLASTWSCYEGGTAPCGECDSCLLREKGFREAGLVDPLMTPCQ